jgi:hypothetical protein
VDGVCRECAQDELVAGTSHLELHAALLSDKGHHVEAFKDVWRVSTQADDRRSEGGGKETWLHAEADEECAGGLMEQLVVGLLPGDRAVEPRLSAYALYLIMLQT